MSESVKVGTVEYPIDSETAKRLREGDIPSELKSRITAEQGSEFCFDFCRQRRLMKRILDQIDSPGICALSLKAELCHRKSFINFITII